MHVICRDCPVGVYVIWRDYLLSFMLSVGMVLPACMSSGGMVLPNIKILFNLFLFITTRCFIYCSDCFLFSLYLLNIGQFSPTTHYPPGTFSTDCLDKTIQNNLIEIKQALIAIAAFGANDHFRYNRAKYL